MKNLMDNYIEFTKKNINKYMKLIFGKYYNKEVIDEYLRTYINARYYNIVHTDKSARAFYVRILNELNYKQEILECKMKEEEIEADERIINYSKEVFEYILFFDNVRNVENFKKIKSLKEIVNKLVEIREKKFKIKNTDDFAGKLYQEIINDMIEKEVFLDNFESDDFQLEIRNSEERENIYFTEIKSNFKISEIYSEYAKNKVLNSGIVAEDKLQIEYILLSVIALKDILNGNFEDIYVAEFSTSLFNKIKKVETILSLISNQALQAKINVNIMYEDYIDNYQLITSLIKKGYNFCITLDNSMKEVEELEKLKIFNAVILPNNLEIYKKVKEKKNIYTNIIEK